MPFGGLLTMGIIGAAGSIGGAAISASASGDAAKMQQQSAQQAQQLQYKEFEQQLSNASPYMGQGQQAINALGWGNRFTNFQGDFQAPTAAEAAAMPGYQFQLQQGEAALNNKLVAGGQTGPNAAIAETNYAEGLASTNYQNAYSNKLNAYNTNFSTALDTFNTNLGKTEAIAQMGLSATGLSNTAGQNYANNAGNNLIQAGNAGAAGTVGAANAWSNALGNTSNNLSSLYLANQLGLGNNSTGQNILGGLIGGG